MHGRAQWTYSLIPFAGPRDPHGRKKLWQLIIFALYVVLGVLFLQCFMELPFDDHLHFFITVLAICYVFVVIDPAASELQPFGCNGICRYFSSVQLTRIECWFYLVFVLMSSRAIQSNRW
jgi:hypothetical protein